MEKSNTSLTVVNNIISSAHSDTTIKDFKMARGNIHVVLETAKEAITDLAEIAKQGQHPRAFEVLAKLIDSTVAASKSLLDVQDKIRQLEKIDNPNEVKSGKTINNNLFVGSTSELQKILKDMREKDDGRE